ncbi:MAG TPA: hypothetical protein VIQ51_02290 [Chryseosolibacter sp.]
MLKNNLEKCQRKKFISSIQTLPKPSTVLRRNKTANPYDTTDRKIVVEILFWCMLTDKLRAVDDELRLSPEKLTGATTGFRKGVIPSATLTPGNQGV